MLSTLCNALNCPSRLAVVWWALPVQGCHTFGDERFGLAGAAVRGSQDIPTPARSVLAPSIAEAGCRASSVTAWWCLSPGLAGLALPLSGRSPRLPSPGVALGSFGIPGL